MTTLTAMQGYPASGKSYIARQLAAQNGATIVETDAISIELRERFPSVFPASQGDWKREWGTLHRVAERRAKSLRMALCRAARAR